MQPGDFILHRPKIKIELPPIEYVEPPKERCRLCGEMLESWKMALQDIVCEPCLQPHLWHGRWHFLAPNFGHPRTHCWAAPPALLVAKALVKLMEDELAEKAKAARAARTAGVAGHPERVHPRADRRSAGPAPGRHHPA